MEEGEKEVRSRNSLLMIDPSCLPDMVVAWVTFVGFSETPLFRENLSNEVPLMQELQLTAYQFPLSPSVPRRSIPYPSKWSSWKENLLRRTISSERPMRTMPLHGPTSEHVAGSQQSHLHWTFQAWVFKFLGLLKIPGDTDQLPWGWILLTCLEGWGSTLLNFYRKEPKSSSSTSCGVFEQGNSQRTILKRDPVALYCQ